MSDQVTRAEFSELVTQLKELVVEMRHANENHAEMKDRIGTVEKEIVVIKQWMSTAQVYLDDAKAGRNTFIKLIVTFLVINSASTYLINLLSSGAGQ